VVFLLTQRPNDRGTAGLGMMRKSVNLFLNHPQNDRENRLRPFQDNKSPKNKQFSEKKAPVWEVLISGTTLVAPERP
jgi:hypothetical protein